MSGYFDTSALCRLYHREPGFEVVDRLLNEPGSQHLVSWLTMLETQSALAQKVRTGEVTARKFQMLCKRLTTDIARRRLLAVRMLRRYFDEVG